MSLLDHPLIQKYFGCVPVQFGGQCRHTDGLNEMCMALRVLNAMQETLSLGDRILAVMHNGEVEDTIEPKFVEDRKFALKLPPQFQPVQKREECCDLHEQFPEAKTNFNCCMKGKTEPPAPKADVCWEKQCAGSAHYGTLPHSKPSEDSRFAPEVEKKISEILNFPNVVTRSDLERLVELVRREKKA